MGLLDGLTGMLGTKKKQKATGFSTGNALIDALLPMLLGGGKGGAAGKLGGLGALAGMLAKSSGRGRGKASAGGLGGLLGGLLGGGGGGGGSAGALGGLGGLLSQLQSRGFASQAQSWVSTGPNEAITADEVEAGLGPDVVDQLAAQTGMARGDVTSQLTTILPGLVDNLTPNGQVPDDAQLGGLLQHLDVAKILGGR